MIGCTKSNDGFLPKTKMRRSFITHFGHKLNSTEYSSIVEKLASTLPEISSSRESFQRRFVSLLDNDYEQMEIS